MGNIHTVSRTMEKQLAERHSFVESRERMNLVNDPTDEIFQLAQQAEKPGLDISPKTLNYLVNHHGEERTRRMCAFVISIIIDNYSYFHYDLISKQWMGPKWEDTINEYTGLIEKLGVQSRARSMARKMIKDPSKKIILEFAEAFYFKHYPQNGKPRKG